MGVVIKADKDWRGVGRPQVAMYSHLPRFLVLTRLVHSAEAAHHMYTVDSVVEYTRSSRSAFYLAPLLILQRPKSANLAMISDHTRRYSNLSRSDFETE